MVLGVSAQNMSAQYAVASCAQLFLRIFVRLRGTPGACSGWERRGIDGFVVTFLMFEARNVDGWPRVRTVVLECWRRVSVAFNVSRM